MADHLSLASDIQQALNNAVSEAQTVFDQPSLGHTSKKKKKRQRDHAEPEGEPVKEKKAKKKEYGGTTMIVDPQTPQGPAQSAGEAVGIEPRKKKKSRKSYNGRGLPDDTSGSVQFHPFRVEESSDPASQAFLSAAAAGISHFHPQPPPQFPPNINYHSANHFVLNGVQSQPQFMYPPTIQYTYPTPFVQQPGFSPMAVPLPDFAYGSNEDILRAIQDLDMSKIANVIKSLGEAAAAASSSGFIRAPSPPPAQPTQLGQVPVASGDILGNPTTEPTREKSKRTLDMSLPGPEQYTSADHAHLLANKWLSANKLADLVKTQGMNIF